MIRWLIAWAALACLQLAMPFLPGAERPVGSAEALFALVVIAAGLCAVASVAVIVRAWMDDTPELGIHGAFFLAVSLLPLVHGITTPGVWYGPNEATMSAVLWALPIACLAGLPLLLPRRWSPLLLHHWRPWVAINASFQLAIAVSLLIHPSLLPVAPMGSPVAIVLAIGAFAATMALSARHLRLYWISRRTSTLVASLGFALVAAGNLIWANGAPMNAGFWLSHGLDITGVFVGTLVAVVAYRRGILERTVLAPLTTRNPLDALELGLDPVVRAFVADLAVKDEITHDHVARTAEVAMAVGTEFGLSSPELHTLGLGALLHDVGKLEIDDSVLNKPGRLTDAEFDYVKTHAIRGERMVAASPVLAPIAPVVRHHHERMDGRGYPDQLRGDDIPQLARIVSVCDAYDAMVHTRQYREGLGRDTAVAVLLEHAGSQWDSDVVETLVRLERSGRVPEEPSVLADVGGQVGCSCTVDLPVASATASLSTR